jgi:hypothetical protein
MAECFCGCGQKVGFFPMSRRSANGVGGKVRHTVERLSTETLPMMEERASQLAPGEGEEGLNMARKLISEGEQHEKECRAVVHGEKEFGAVHWPSVRGWVRNGDGMASFLGSSPEQQARIIGSG